MDPCLLAFIVMAVTFAFSLLYELRKEEREWHLRKERHDAEIRAMDAQTRDLRGDDIESWWSRSTGMVNRLVKDADNKARCLDDLARQLLHRILRGD